MPEISMNEVKDLGSLGIKPETHMTDAEVKNLFDKIKQKFSDTIKEIKETEILKIIAKQNEYEYLLYEIYNLFKNYIR